MTVAESIDILEGLVDKIYNTDGTALETCESTAALLSLLEAASASE